MKIPSGKFILRLNPDLHLELQRAAKKLEVSLNSTCISIIESFIKNPGHTPLHSIDDQPRSFPPLNEIFLSMVIEHWKSQCMALIIFGSAVRGEMKHGSDIDLLLVCPNEIELNRTLYSKWDQFYAKIIKKNKPLWKVTPHFVHLPQSYHDAGGIWYEVAMEGEILWKNNTNTPHILQAIRLAMAEGKIKRQVSHGHPYWIKIA